MITREELIKTEEYWFETIQNEIYRIVSDYLKKEGINQTQLANKLGVSRGYISQIMNGNFNYTLKKLIELSLAVNIAPSISFTDLNEFIKEDQKNRFEMQYSPFLNFDIKGPSFSIQSGNTSTLKKIEQSYITPNVEAA